ncbi:coiled-coil domain-containing protein 138-like isoform X2 [Lineus longissimus]|uniref:coiled-coil domain-containing protein 138-like isoform X2 n=1 Tax=Lineus longissimus TaxID=88925 RepID=UPI00315CC8FC
MASIDSPLSDNEESATDYLAPPGNSSPKLFDTDVIGSSQDVDIPVKELRDRLFRTPEWSNQEEDSTPEIDMVTRDEGREPADYIDQDEEEDEQGYDSYEDDRDVGSQTLRMDERRQPPFRIPSLESLSTVAEQGRTVDTQSSLDVAEVFAELQLIHLKLKSENKLMQRREYEVQQREKKVARSEAKIGQLVDREIKKRRRQYEEQSQAELEKMEEMLREKLRENNRLKDSFETIKQANDGLRKQLDVVTMQHEKLTKQHSSLQARLTNLQRKQEYDSRQKDAVTMLQELQIQPKKTGAPVKSTKMKPSKPSPNTYDVISMLLEWLSQSQLRQGFIEQPKQFLDGLMHDVDDEVIQEKCVKLLPNLVEILRECPGASTRVYLPFLQFIYWALLHIDRAQGSQKTSLCSTVRRLGEELYRPRQQVRFTASTQGGSPGSNCGSPDRPKEGAYFRSPNLHIRFLSSLIILKTLSQVDHLAHVFDCLKNDLKEEQAKELFIHYYATPVILPYFKPINKAFVGSAVDIFLQIQQKVLRHVWNDKLLTRPLS